jgi:type III secretion protein V
VLLSVHEVPAQLVVVPGGALDEQAVERVRGEVVALLRARAADFLGLAEVQRLLDELEQFAPATVRNVVPRPVSLATLADVLRRLLEERVSIRDLRAVLEALAGVAAAEKDPLALAEHVRSQMRRAITFRLTGGAGEVGVVLLDPVVEDTVRRAITKTPAGAFLALPPQASRDVRASVRRALEPLVAAAAATGGGAQAPCILTQPDVRRFVRKIIEVDWPDVWVVTFGELLPEVTIKPVGRAVP